MAFLDALALRLGRRLPLVLQTEATECGLACLAMIAGYHGHHTGLMELRRRFSVSLKGISLKQLIQTAHRLGLGTRAVKLDLGDLGKLKLPCVLHWNFNHFVVLKAVDGRGAVLHDPAHGQRRLGLEEVSRSFTGVAWNSGRRAASRNRRRRRGSSCWACSARSPGCTARWPRCCCSPARWKCSR